MAKHPIAIGIRIHYYSVRQWSLPLSRDCYWHHYCMHSSLALAFTFIIILSGSGLCPCHYYSVCRQWSLPLSRDAQSLQHCYGRAWASLSSAFINGIHIHNYHLYSYYYLSGTDNRGVAFAVLPTFFLLPNLSVRRLHAFLYCNESL